MQNSTVSDCSVGRWQCNKSTPDYNICFLKALRFILLEVVVRFVQEWTIIMLLTFPRKFGTKF